MSHRLAGALVFASSAAVLVLEILAGRLLAPYFGVTLETFTAIIGVVLGGIALGTWIGGRLADSRTEPIKLIGPVLAAGGALAAAAVPMARWAGPPLRDTGLTGLVLLTALSMLPGTSMLSAIPPIVVKTILADLSETGRVVGRISALGTAGALFGTFTAGFLLVAAFSTPVIITGIAAGLVVAGFGLGLLLGRRPPVVLTVAALAGMVLGPALSSPCDVETAYFCAAAVPDPDRPTGSFLVLDTVTHAYVDTSDPAYLRFTSTRMFAAAIEAMTSGPVGALHIGGGGFSIPTWLDAVRPGSTNVVLELDASLVEFVQEVYSPAPVDRILTGDARISLSEAGTGFDVAVGDAFGGLAVPWHLTTVEFISGVADRLDADGLYVMNLVDHGELAFIRAEAATVAEVFPHVALVTVPGRFERGGNFMLAGAKGPIPSEEIVARAADLDLDVVVVTGAALTEFIGDAQVLTDDYAPVDQLLDTG